MEYVGTSLGKDSALTLLEAPGGEREPVEGDFIMDTWGEGRGSFLSCWTVDWLSVKF